MDAIEGIKRRRLAAETISNVLQAKGYNHSVDPNELHVRDEFVAFHTSSEFSEVFFRDLAPVQDHNVSYCHFTGFEAFASIIETATLRLYSITRRLGEHELTSFINEHELHGYLADGGDELKVYEKLAQDLFYISLAPSDGRADSYLWGGFGEFETGVRLELRFQTSDTIRRMFYRGQETLLKQANNALAANGFGALVPWGLSRMISFYLPDDYSNEREFRLLRKRYEGALDGPWRYDGQHEYLPLALGTAGSGASVELHSIKLGKYADMTAARHILSGSAFDRVELHAAP